MLKPDFIRGHSAVSRSRSASLRRIAIGRFPNFPAIVIIDNPTSRNGQVEHSGRQLPLDHARFREYLASWIRCQCAIFSPVFCP